MVMECHVKAGWFSLHYPAMFPTLFCFSLPYRKFSINSAVTKISLLFDPFHFLILLMILYRRNLILLLLLP